MVGSPELGRPEVSRARESWGNWEEWEEFSRKFWATVKGINPQLHAVIQWTETQAEEVCAEKLPPL